MKPGRRKPPNRILVKFKAPFDIKPYSPPITNDYINQKLKDWVGAVEFGEVARAANLYEQIRRMYDNGERPDWIAAGLPGPSAFFGWFSRDLRPLSLIPHRPLKLAEDEVLYRAGPKKLHPSTFPGFRGEPSVLPGMKKHLT